jgi:hypothetical protein
MPETATEPWTPKPEDRVGCPADRGDDPYFGVVVSVDDRTSENHLGVPFRWTTVRSPKGTQHVWPSIRLERAA